MKILQGDALTVLRGLPEESVHCCVTSPPYWGLRDYGVPGQIGLERTPEEYVSAMVSVFREMRRVLRADGTAWVNLGDSYTSGGRKTQENDNIGSRGPVPVNYRSPLPTGLKPKDLVGIPWRVAFALQADGWYLRSDIIWSKKNPMPESVQGSHYSRHRVTVEEYERLSGLRYVDERAGDDWAGNMPDLSEREVSSSKAPLSAKSQGNRDRASQGIARGCAGAAAPVQPVGVREAQSGQIQRDQQRQGCREEEERDVQSQPPGETSGSGSTPADERQTRTASAAENGGCEVQADRKRESAQAARIRDAKRSDSGDGQATDRRRVAGDSDRAQWALPLLQPGKKTNSGSCDSSQQGWTAHEGECRASVPAVQLTQAGQDIADLVGCPGCPKCIKHHGYIFHLSAGRPTKAHEYIFLLAKSERYYYDADAIAERTTHIGLTWGGRKAQGEGPRRGIAQGGLSNMGGSGGTRNKRTVWTVSTCPTPEAHFATYPPDLIEPCILAGCPEGGVVLDPFAGGGTTGLACLKNGREFLGIELNPEYIAIARRRAEKYYPLLVEEATA